MYERITSNYMNANVINNVLNNKAVLMELQTQISSGKKFDRTSEDVLSSITVLDSNSSLAKIENFLKNIATAKSEVETADKAILTGVNAVHDARELVIQGLNATSGTEELNMMAEQIDQIIQQIKDLGNTKYGTNYIFGGKETAAAPFSTPADGEVQYMGSVNGSHERVIQITEGVSVSVNLSGDDVFGYYYTGDHDNDILTPDTLDGQGLIATLSRIKEEMASATPDKEVIRTELENLDGNLQSLLKAQATLGSLEERLEITKNILEEKEITITDKKSKAEDIDYAKTISDLTMQQTALQASLQVGANIMNYSLMDYM